MVSTKAQRRVYTGFPVSVKGPPCTRTVGLVTFHACPRSRQHRPQTSPRRSCSTFLFYRRLLLLGTEKREPWTWNRGRSNARPGVLPRPGPGAPQPVWGASQPQGRRPRFPRLSVALGLKVSFSFYFIVLSDFLFFPWVSFIIGTLFLMKMNI